MKFVINADDCFGYDGVTEKIVSFLKEGLISQTTAILTFAETLNNNMKLFDKESLKDKVGLHVSLTRGHPVSKEMSQSKYASSNWLLNYTLNKRSSFFFLPRSYKKAVEAEIEAQMILYKKLGFRSLHFDSHGNYHCYFSLYKLFIKLGKKHGFASIRLPFTDHSKNIVYRLIKKHITKNFKRNFKTVEFATLTIDEALNYKGDKSIEIMVHPSPNSSDEDEKIRNFRRLNSDLIMMGEL